MLIANKKIYGDEVRLKNGEIHQGSIVAITNQEIHLNKDKKSLHFDRNKIFFWKYNNSLRVGTDLNSNDVDFNKIDTYEKYKILFTKPKSGFQASAFVETPLIYSYFGQYVGYPNFSFEISYKYSNLSLGLKGGTSLVLLTLGHPGNLGTDRHLLVPIYNFELSLRYFVLSDKLYLGLNPGLRASGGTYGKDNPVLDQTIKKNIGEEGSLNYELQQVFIKPYLGFVFMKEVKFRASLEIGFHFSFKDDYSFHAEIDSEESQTAEFQNYLDRELVNYKEEVKDIWKVRQAIYLGVRFERFF